MDECTDRTKEIAEFFLKNNVQLLEERKSKKIHRIAFTFSRRLRYLYDEYLKADTDEEKLDACVAVLNEYDECFLRKLYTRIINLKEDVVLRIESLGRRKVIDHSDHSIQDYYSVVVVIKDEARNMREFILFYKLTGADRIYIYDNGSTDNLLEVIEPFLKNGFVVYKRWPGKVAQAPAYRDAVRRTKKRTKWLAILDADEYLFSPKGSMPEQLKDYEEYPGVGVNWILFGDNGHDRRPEGLVMDNYTTALADHNYYLNCLIKSIIQPDQVSSINHTHFAVYKKGRLTVDEKKNQIDNRNAFFVGQGKAFTAENRRDKFRINHYKTKSSYEKELLPFRAQLEEDNTIRPYADLVRKIF